MGARYGLPANQRLLLGAEVVVLVPALVLIGRVAVQAVEADEISEPVTVRDEVLQSGFGFRGPLARTGFAALLDECPVRAEPTVVVVGLLAHQLFRIARRHHGDGFLFLVPR